MTKDHSVIKEEEEEQIIGEEIKDAKKEIVKQEKSYLKRLQKKVFSRLRNLKPVSKLMNTFHSSVQSLVRNKSFLSPKVISAFSNKLKETEAAVNQFNKGIVFDKFFEQPKPPTVPELPPHSWFSLAVSEMTKSETAELKTSA